MLRFVFVLALFAVATYLVVRVFQERGVITPRSSRPEHTERRRVLAPDDDEDFLRDLDRKRGNPPE